MLCIIIIHHQLSSKTSITQVKARKMKRWCRKCRVPTVDRKVEIVSRKKKHWRQHCVRMAGRLVNNFEWCLFMNGRTWRGRQQTHVWGIGEITFTLCHQKFSGPYTREEFFIVNMDPNQSEWGWAYTYNGMKIQPSREVMLLMMMLGPLCSSG